MLNDWFPKAEDKTETSFKASDLTLYLGSIEIECTKSWAIFPAPTIPHFVAMILRTRQESR